MLTLVTLVRVYYKFKRRMRVMKGLLILPVVLVIVVSAGWVQNIIKLTECDFEAPYKAEIIHSIGILPPVGMITGWMDFGK